MASSVALNAEADQKNTDSATDRILRWIRTEKHTFKTDYVGREASGSTIGTEQINGCASVREPNFALIPSASVPRTPAPWDPSLTAISQMGKPGNAVQRITLWVSNNRK
jgi:hypothetical protein